MKKQITSIVAMLTIISSLAFAAAVGVNARVTAKIPFEFGINGKTLPAGTYSLTSGPSNNSIMIVNRDNGKAIAVLSRTVQDYSRGQARLIFRRYGNKYFLAEAFDGNIGQEFNRSKAEREAAKQTQDNLAGGAGFELVTLNAVAGQ